MISFKKYQDRWNRFLRERKYRISVFGLTPHFDWKFILFISFITLITIAIVGFGTYKNIVNLSESDISLEPIKQTFTDPVEVNDFIAEFDQKEARFNALIEQSVVAE